MPLVRMDYICTTSLEYVTNFRTLWTLMAFSNNDIASNLVSIQPLQIVHCTSNSIWRRHLYYAKSISTQPNVKLRHLIINPIFNQPKHHYYIGATCSFTYVHKTIVEIHLQGTKNNSLVRRVLSIHHLFDHRLKCRAFPVTKEITRTRLNLTM